MSAQSVGPNPYVKVQFGSIDEVDATPTKW